MVAARHEPLELRDLFRVHVRGIHGAEVARVLEATGGTRPLSGKVGFIARCCVVREREREGERERGRKRERDRAGESKRASTARARARAREQKDGLTSDCCCCCRRRAAFAV
jgi:hypothetical protein